MPVALSMPIAMVERSAGECRVSRDRVFNERHSSEGDEDKQDAAAAP
jgi:hypothetical protein